MSRAKLQLASGIAAWMVLGALSPAVRAAEADGREPRAVLADLQGTVWVRGADGVTERGELGRRLREGDVVETGPEARASLFLSGGQILDVLEGSRVRITKELAPDAGMPPRLARLSTPTLKVVEEGMWVLTDPHGSLLVSPLRGGDQEDRTSFREPLPLSPRRELVTGFAPTFLWTAAGDPVVVAVADAAGQRVHWRSDPTRETRVRYPAHAPPLRPGASLTWWLEAAAGGTRLTEIVHFDLASHEQMDHLRGFEEEMEAVARDATPTLAGFLRCSYFEGLGAWTRTLEAARHLGESEAAALEQRIQRLAQARMNLDSGGMRVLISLLEPAGS